MHDLNPAAEFISVCTRLPSAHRQMEFATYKSQSNTTVGDDDAEAFEVAAQNADYFFRYDPNAPRDSPARLPWPYHRMSCDTLSSSNTPDFRASMEACQTMLD